MAQINLPKELLQKEAFKTLPAKEKGEYLSNLLKKVLELNPDGLTISQIKESTGLTYSTIWHHLEVLSCTAQIYKTSRGNTDVFYPLGKSSHLNDYDHHGIHYSLSLVENAKGKFVSIYEQKEDAQGKHTVCSGVMIPINLADDLIKALSKVK